ncbi:MAG: Signal transduction histidine kinase [Thermoanaerobacterales bacterium 50_218]|nr:MAG: Signal transduction histidine kinase [Thermoanaerobacterales bacterium 50_218]HAA89049.1 histidine kinase [Peptococcaceae bacterium]
MKNKDNLLTILAILLIDAILVTLSFYFQRLVEIGHVVSPELAVAVINAVIFVVVLVLLVISRKLFLLERQGKFVKVQELYIEHLQELVRVTKAQRHDFVNHLQVVYALLKTGQIGKAQKYIEDLYHDVRISGEILRVNIPELAALLLVKMGIASLKNISFTIEVDTNLKMLRIKPLELNTVVGNLVDNAFEAVASLAADKKKVTLRIFETRKHFVFQTSNPGFIEKGLRDKIFEPGFSTKPGSRGIGLASVKSVVEKNGGKILVSSGKDRGTKFTVIFPKQRRGR